MDLLVSLANNIGNKQERDVHYNRIQEDETDIYIEKLKVDYVISLKKLSHNSWVIGLYSQALTKSYIHTRDTTIGGVSLLCKQLTLPNVKLVQFHHQLLAIRINGSLDQTKCESNFQRWSCDFLNIWNIFIN